MSEMTVADLAERLVKVTGDPTPYAERQIRYWATNGLFGRDVFRLATSRTDPRKFNEIALGRARLLAALVKLGLEDDQLKAGALLADKMDPDDLHRIYGDGARPVDAALEHVVEAAREGRDETWLLRLYATGAGEICGGGFTTSPSSNPFLEAAYPIEVKIDATRLLKPLFFEA